MQLNTTSETRFEVDVPDEDYIFCVQAQDIFTNGPFGPWSNCSWVFMASAARIPLALRATLDDILCSVVNSQHSTESRRHMRSDL